MLIKLSKKLLKNQSQQKKLYKCLYLEKKLYKGLYRKFKIKINKNKDIENNLLMIMVLFTPGQLKIAKQIKFNKIVIIKKINYFLIVLIKKSNQM